LWPHSATFWCKQRVVVTSGAGFLGSSVVEKLQARGAAEVFVPHIWHNACDLANEPGLDAALAEADCVVVVTDQSMYYRGDMVKRTQMLVDTRKATEHI
jgi:nucleoside-diphosphate-sugar epimerase